MTRVMFYIPRPTQMNKRHTLIIAILIISSLSLTFFNSKLYPAQAQTSNTTAQLTITGLVENPLTLTLHDIQTMPQTTEYAEMYCVDDPRTPLEQGAWTGVELSYLLQQAGVSPDAIKVAFLASDDYSTDLTVQMAMQANILVAYQKDNSSLGALQLVVPGNWGYKWITNPTQIQLVNYDFLGTTESEGYSDDATVSNVGGTLPVTQPNPITIPAQNSTLVPTSSSPSVPTFSPTASPVASNPEHQSTGTHFAYATTASAIIAGSAAVALVFILTKRKRKPESEDSLATV